MTGIENSPRGDGLDTDSDCPDFLLFTTEGCHLCDVAIQLISCVLDLSKVYIELVDIAVGDESDQLIDRYGERIPVLMHRASEKEIGWPFNSEQLTSWLKGC